MTPVQERPTAVEFLGGVGEAAMEELIKISKDTKTLLEDVLKRPLIIETEPVNLP